MKYLHVGLLFCAMMLFTGCADTINNIGVKIGQGFITLIFFAVIPVISSIIGKMNILAGIIAFVIIEILAIYGFSNIVDKDFITTAMGIWKLGLSWF